MVKIMENPIKVDDLGVPLFLETPMKWEQGSSLHFRIFCWRHVEADEGMNKVSCLYWYVVIQGGPPTHYQWSYNLYKWPKISG